MDIIFGQSSWLNYPNKYHISPLPAFNFLNIHPNIKISKTYVQEPEL